MYRSPILAALTMLLAATFGGCTGAPALEGTYVLHRRELPDGTTVQPPEVVGCLTYDGRHRNFNVY